jgi:hypothetical protein
MSESEQFNQFCTIKEMKSKIPIDAKDWTVEDWRDLWNGIEEIRQKIAGRHDPTKAPPVDNEHVAQGCEQFSCVFCERLAEALRQCDQLGNDDAAFRVFGLVDLRARLTEVRKIACTALAT